MGVSCVGVFSQHMSSSKASNYLLENSSLDLPSRDATPPSTKAGYLWYAEPRTFGTHWIRLYFSIKKGMLLSEVWERSCYYFLLTYIVCFINSRRKWRFQYRWVWISAMLRYACEHVQSSRWGKLIHYELMDRNSLKFNWTVADSAFSGVVVAAVWCWFDVIVLNSVSRKVISQSVQFLY